ncbi:hypothetical protein FIE12Z_5225, partial [Fusarium flagelliforme]
MSSEEEPNPWVQRPSGTNRTDARAPIDQEDFMDMKSDLKGLYMVIAEAQKEAEALRQRVEDLEASGHPCTRPPSSYYGGLSTGRVLPDPPVPEPDSALARQLAEIQARIDRSLRARGLRYLEKALTIKRLLNRET